MSVSLSTHVLDTERGSPGSGVRVELRRGSEIVASAETDGDGRAQLADGLDPGHYSLAFEPPSPYFRRVELELALDDGHHHVPLLVSSFGCVTYRGS
ncbi:MAG: 5-hydroxyisourate hydrolase [Gaiellaceae bacterium]|jgi:5-hydroxyisourate hydrolase|nr:5-hydroxyisourate hydrolase [Gaiellaceae bacterium]